MLPGATLGGEPPILCFNYVCPVQPFCEVTASSVPPGAAQCQRAVRSTRLAQEGFGAAVETVGVSRAVLGGCHAVTPAQGTSLVRTGLEMGVTWASPPFSLILDFYASCELVEMAWRADSIDSTADPKMSLSP